MINTLGRLLNKVINFNEPIRLTEKKKIIVAARTGSVFHLEVILIEDLCVMSAKTAGSVRALCWGRGEEWKRGWEGGLVLLRREEVCVVWSSIPLRPFGCKGIAALRRQR